MYEYRGKIISVVDGDTLHVALDLGLDVTINVTLRLAGLDCPEISTEAGVNAKAYTVKWIADNADARGWLGIDTVKDRREKYGRYLATVLPFPTGKTLNQALLDDGHAVPYDGGHRGP